MCMPCYGYAMVVSVLRWRLEKPWVSFHIVQIDTGEEFLTGLLQFF